MRIAFAALVAVHALIHLMGFALEVNEVSTEVVSYNGGGR